MIRPAVGKELEETIDIYLTSFLSWDVLLYFHANTGTRKTSKELAGDLGRRQREVYQVLDELARKGILTRHFNKGSSFFMLNEARENQIKLNRLIEALDDQTFRLVVVSKLLQKELEKGNTIKVMGLES